MFNLRIREIRVNRQIRDSFPHFHIFTFPHSFITFITFITFPHSSLSHFVLKLKPIP